MGDIHIHLKKQHLIVIISMALILGIILVTNAYNSPYGNPAVMGHSADELHVDFGGTTQNIQQVFNSITDDSGNIDYANTAENANNVEWNNVNNKPDVATQTWVNNQDYATEDYVDSNSADSNCKVCLQLKKHDGTVYTTCDNDPTDSSFSSWMWIGDGSSWVRHMRVRVICS